MAPLGSEALAELVRDWVGSSRSVAALPALIAERSGGNPFFAEEIVLSLIDTGRLAGTRGAYELAPAIDGLEVPATVQSLLAARIDRLGENEKQLLYAAAVIGKEFPRPLLESVIEIEGGDLEAALAALLDAELVYERAIYPVAEYAFKHPLTHEVALGAQLAGARRTRHASVAAAIASAEADRLDEHAGLLAHHWTEAGESMQAATWHVRAARWVRANDLAASRRHWALARELLVALPESAERTKLLLEVYPELLDTLDRLGAVRGEADAAYAEGIAVARQAGDRRQEGLIEAAYAYLASGQNDIDTMLEHGSGAAKIADAEGDRPVQLFARFSWGRALNWKGRLQEGVRVFGEGVEIGGDDDAAAIEVLGWRPYVECLSVCSTGHAFLGQIDEALAIVDKLEVLLREHGRHSDLSSPAADRVWTCWITGDAERAVRFASESLREAERFGADRNVVYGLLISGVASGLARRWRESIAYYEHACERIASTGAGAEWQNVIDPNLAVALAEVGDHERALALALKSVERTRAEGLDLILTVSGVTRARVLRTVGGPREQEELATQITETLALIEKWGMKGYLPLLLLERAGLARLRGDAEAMTRDLAQARQLFGEMGVTGWDDYARSIEG
jgi:adenylate cyclase